MLLLIQGVKAIFQDLNASKPFIINCFKGQLLQHKINKTNPERENST